jgi:hypothetical protein
MLKKIFLMSLVSMLIGCGNDQQWLNFENSMGGLTANAKTATVDKSEFKSGQLRIFGQCRPDGEILLVLPATSGDTRIIGSPKCIGGKYALRTSTFGRPPCEIIVEYGGDKSVRAKVAGTNLYCP